MLQITFLVVFGKALKQQEGWCMGFGSMTFGLDLHGAKKFLNIIE
jgi:hypothetical protein